MSILLLFGIEGKEAMAKKYNKPYWEVYLWHNDKCVMCDSYPNENKAKRCVKQLKKYITDPDCTFDIMHWTGSVL